ncbi:hypothetical protein PCCS19_51630 [Paenibacillus sp. CCS19]|uniref:hypothetical protein n=1 Tax=Paenibacillus sp. CCS19 TaxID=3158387 RepID=UPI0025677056|nr:hypothetical protein [Paenibacillus cellulosilyticus]GMK42104.1 hypothetical protein PCCS19_51630 [Paenibacillus cellulosilyticus]
MAGKRIQIDQRVETFDSMQCGMFHVQYAYARSAESRAADESGQDYVAFIERGDSLSFCICDGVGQSYYGDLAARLAGDELARWLSQLKTSDELVSSELSRRLMTFMSELCAPASKAVEQHAIPVQAPALLRDVLTEKRIRGSETMFIGGRFDAPSRELPHGRMLLAWMGDMRLRLWRDDEECTSELGHQLSMDERWSTKRGLLGGEPHVFVSGLAGKPYTRITAYSDGLAVIDDCKVPPSAIEVQNAINRSAAQPTSDDVAYFDVCWDAAVLYSGEQSSERGLLSRLFRKKG